MASVTGVGGLDLTGGERERKVIREGRVREEKERGALRATFVSIPDY